MLFIGRQRLKSKILPLCFVFQQDNLKENLKLLPALRPNHSQGSAGFSKPSGGTGHHTKVLQISLMKVVIMTNRILFTTSRNSRVMNRALIFQAKPRALSTRTTDAKRGC